MANTNLFALLYNGSLVGNISNWDSQYFSTLIYTNCNKFSISLPVDTPINILSYDNNKIQIVPVTDVAPAYDNVNQILIRGTPLVSGTKVSTQYTINNIPIDPIKSFQKEILSSKCGDTIVSSFTSSALGSVYTYPSSQIDQLNLTASVIDALRIPNSWQPSTVYTVGQDVMANQWLRLICITAGTSGTTVPTVAGTDGTVNWALWSTPIDCVDSNGVYAYRHHTQLQVHQVAFDAKVWVVSNKTKLDALYNQVDAATTVSAIKAIIWV